MHFLPLSRGLFPRVNDDEAERGESDLKSCQLAADFSLKRVFDNVAPCQTFN